MKTGFMTAILLVAFPLAAMAGVTKEDIRKLAEAGISDAVIVAYIKANRPAPKLSSDDIVELKKAGISDEVVTALLANQGKPAPTVTRTTYSQPQSVVIYQGYYSRPYFSGYGYRSGYYCPSYSFGYNYRGRYGRVGLRYGW